LSKLADKTERAWRIRKDNGADSKPAKSLTLMRWLFSFLQSCVLIGRRLPWAAYGNQRHPGIIQRPGPTGTGSDFAVSMVMINGRGPSLVACIMITCFLLGEGVDHIFEKSGDV